MTLLEAEDSEALDALVDDCETLGIRRRLLLVRLPRHIAHPLRPAVRRLLMEHLAPFAGADRVRLFRLADEDLAITWRNGGPRDRMIEDAADDLRSLLAGLGDDPKAAAGGARPTRTAGQAADLLLCDLPDEADLARRFLDDTSAFEDTNPAWQPPGQALDLRELKGVESALGQADVARFVRRQRIWDLAAPSRTVRWEHRRLDLADLGSTLAPGFDLTADPWLLRRLARTLDRRLLALLTDPMETRGALPFMIDLSVPSMLDPAFRRFDDALPHALRNQTAIRISPIDLVDDPASFGVARDAVKNRGHRLVLAARHIETLSGFALPRTGADYVECSWRALHGANLVLGNIPPASVILTDVPDSRALGIARGLGISLASGPALERVG